MENNFVLSKKCIIPFLCICLAVGCAAPNVGKPTPALDTAVINNAPDPSISTVTFAPTNTRQIDPEPGQRTPRLEEHRTKTAAVFGTPPPKVHTPTVDFSEATLSALETKRLLLKLLENNGDCTMPCVWGLTPQFTDAHTSQAFMKRFGKIYTEKDINIHSDATKPEAGYAEFNFHANSSRVHIVISYRNQGAKLEQLMLRADSSLETDNGDGSTSELTFEDPLFAQLLGYYTLPNILSVYGKPSEILIKPILYEAPYLVKDLISLALVYSKQGFLIEYILLKNTEGSFLVGCPRQMGDINIVAWSLEENLPLSDVLKNKSGTGINSESLGYYMAIEAATSFTIDEFYKTFSDRQNTNCIATAASLWEY